MRPMAVVAVPAAIARAADGILRATRAAPALQQLLGAVVGTATLGTIFSAFYRSNVALPGGLSPEQEADAHESIGGAISVAHDLPPALSARLVESARTAFDSGIAPTALIAAALTLTAAVVVVMSFRGSARR